MTLIRSAWVMHMLVEDAAGPLASRKPTGAAPLESALRLVPGNLTGALGHPGKRFRVACRAVARPTLQHRATITPEMVNCPRCVAMMEANRGQAARALGP